MLFPGILVVPELVAVNAKYYGWRIALHIAGVMYVSMVSTALTLYVLLATLDITPESSRVVEDFARFELDCTFWLNVAMVGLAGWIVWLHRRAKALKGGGRGGMDMESGDRVNSELRSWRSPSCRSARSSQPWGDEPQERRFLPASTSSPTR